MTEVQVLSRKVFIGILLLFVDQVHEEYMDELLTSLQVYVLHYTFLVYQQPYTSACEPIVCPPIFSVAYSLEYSEYL
jgi:hypothetical protein